MSLEGKSQDEINALAAIADSVMSNPKTRTSFQRILKAANPGISVPEIELEDRVASAVKPHVDKLEALEAQNAQRAAQDQANALYENLRDDRVVKSRSDFNELVKYAAEKGFQTNETGLRIAGQQRRAELEPAEPTPHTAAGAIDLADKQTMGDIMKNPNAWARSQANAAIAELQKRKAAA